MKTIDALREFYENYDEDGRLASRHGQVEYLTTMRYVKKYLRPGMRILEIGAATGRYSHTLAREGYEVDAVELLAHNIHCADHGIQNFFRCAALFNGFCNSSTDQLSLAATYQIIYFFDRHNSTFSFM